MGTTPAILRAPSAIPTTGLGAALLAAVAVGLSLFLAGCTPSADLDEAVTSLYEADGAYTTAMASGDVQGIVDLYAADATRYPPDGDPVGGPEAIRGFAQGIAGTPGFGLEAWPISTHVAADGRMGFTLNHLRVTWASEDGAPMVQWLRDAHVWRRGDDGAWLIVEDVWQVMDTPPTVAALLDADDVEVTSLGFWDLMGGPVVFSWDAAGDLPANPPPGALVPVEVLSVRWDGGDGGSSTRLVIASADTESPTFLLDEMIQVVGEDGGGYMPLDDLAFQAGEEGEPLVLVVSLGGSPGEDGVMPGAPWVDRWRLVDGVYRRN